MAIYCVFGYSTVSGHWGKNSYLAILPVRYRVLAIQPWALHRCIWAWGWQDEGGAYGNHLCFVFQHGAENGGKRKKDRNLDDLKKEVALVRTEDLLERPATLRRAAVVKQTA